VSDTIDDLTRYDEICRPSCLTAAWKTVRCIRKEQPQPAPRAGLLLQG
jgi:hypothetical protein